jgi:hypothetical protein
MRNVHSLGRSECSGLYPYITPPISAANYTPYSNVGEVAAEARRGTIDNIGLLRHKVLVQLTHVHINGGCSGTGS